GLGYGQIRGQRDGVSRTSELRREFVEEIVSARDEPYSVAPFDQLPGELRADARRGAGDQGERRRGRWRKTHVVLSSRSFRRFWSRGIVCRACRRARGANNLPTP